MIPQPHYIPFAELDILAGQHPDYGPDWDATPEDRRRKVHDWLERRLDDLPWRGRQYQAVTQGRAFPRIIPPEGTPQGQPWPPDPRFLGVPAYIDSRGIIVTPWIQPGILLRWDNDPDRLAARGTMDRIISIDDIQVQVIEIQLPVRRMADAAAELVHIATQSELTVLRDIGVKRSKVGPLETEFFAGKERKSDDPLPGALWEVMHEWSALHLPRQLTIPLRRA